MIRFVDVRGYGTGGRFAFYDTVRDRFLSTGLDQTWATWDDLLGELEPVSALVAERAADEFDLPRLRRICPPWVFKSEPDQDAETSSDRFAIGSKVWPGLSKLAEEAGEMVQIVGKFIGTRGNVHHWDGTNLRSRLIEEMGDVNAAIAFVIGANAIDPDLVDNRAREKLAVFSKWHAEGDTNLPEAPTVVVHGLRGGLPRCRFSNTVPRDWPPGNSWTVDEEKITCGACREAKA